ncbi:MAG: hypothetical protein NZM40_01540 [Sphingomonadaceae bacterium]|uniref:hypothetical protein n=1 Tax=Thermaurantiacus sp. TaxID=2820283 RepID=UPI00298EFB55|nr:hypothetical protein [Thermaurantiacus sp.]MCS6986125.1 hypothetical protein [Sphingomonadaceae bacterium]MDW8414651.1 hypothetical protein [Thermaurantiacus sp.]
MEPAALLKLLIVGSIVLFVLSIGLDAPPRSLRAGLRQRAAVGRSMLAMFVLVPAFTLAITFLLPLDPAARAALLALSVSPVPPILPAKETRLGGDIALALARLVAAGLACLIAAPLLIAIAGLILGRELGSDPAAIARTVLVTILLPLGAGIALAAMAPGPAARAASTLRRLATLLLGLGFGVLLLKAAPGILAVATGPAMLAIALMTAFGLAVGHWLGGPDPGSRRGLAIATASRHPGVAIGLAAATEIAARQPVVAVVLLYLVAGAILSQPYLRWAKGQS